MRTNVFIHPLAYVSDEAKIGAGSKIWINSQIREGASIGENCIISKDTYIDFDVAIGDNVKIQNGVSVYHGVTIGNDVFIGPNAAFTNDYLPRSCNSHWVTTETVLKDGCSVGANATIVCGHTLGEYCMIGAGSVVTKDIPPYALAVGNPARVIGHVCKCGQRLVNDVCPVCGFRIRKHPQKGE